MMTFSMRIILKSVPYLLMVIFLMMLHPRSMDGIAGRLVRRVRFPWAAAVIYFCYGFHAEGLPDNMQWPPNFAGALILALLSLSLGLIWYIFHAGRREQGLRFIPVIITAVMAVSLTFHFYTSVLFPFLTQIPQWPVLQGILRSSVQAAGVFLAAVLYLVWRRPESIEELPAVLFLYMFFFLFRISADAGPYPLWPSMFWSWSSTALAWVVLVGVSRFEQPGGRFYWITILYVTAMAVVQAMLDHLFSNGSALWLFGTCLMLLAWGIDSRQLMGNNSGVDANKSTVNEITAS